VSPGAKVAHPKKGAAKPKDGRGGARRARARKPKPLVLTYSRPEMKRLLEAVLFASDKPVPAAVLGQILSNSPEEEVRGALGELAKEYEEWGRSFVLKEVGGGYLLYSHPAFEPWVRKLFRGRLTLRLSKSALETIAIVAYRQPVAKQEIEIIRGVNADGVLHTLLERKLIRVVGRKEGMGRALLYGTTNEFLQYMGLNDLAELPQIEEMRAILEAQEVPPADGLVEPQGPFASRLPGVAPITAGADAPVAPSSSDDPAGATALAEPVAPAETTDYAGTEAVADAEPAVDSPEGEPAASEPAPATEAAYDGEVAAAPEETEKADEDDEDKEDDDEEDEDGEDDKDE